MIEFDRSLTVSQLNEYVRRTLAADPFLKTLQLRGEISNFKRHSAGHLYFSLKDEASRIACVMFRSAAAGLRAQPRDGMRVVVTGHVSLYVQTGQYQFYVDSMRDDGVGALYLAFEELKERLRQEGLFDPALKKPLHLLPRGIGIATSPTGAVVHDIEQVAARRNPGIPLFLRPTLVQGEGAAADIVRALAALDRNPAIDVIIVGRGGGSLEELWPFNEEAVARAIARCSKPVISAVGHETDFTIADFVADVRAATPSAAAELAVPRIDDLSELLSGYLWRIKRAQAQRITMLGLRLDALRERLERNRPSRRIVQQRAQVDALLGLLAARMEAVLENRRLRLHTQAARLPQRTLALLSQKRLHLRALEGKLHTLSPEKVLGRGYALITGPNGGVISEAAQAQAGETLRVRLRKGSLDAEVREVHHGA